MNKATLTFLLLFLNSFIFAGNINGPQINFDEEIKDYQFFIFVSSRCSYCDVMYQTLTQIDGLNLTPVSMDSKLKYPNSILYEDFGIELPINVTPYVWALDKDKNLIPICAGSRDLNTFKKIFVYRIEQIDRT